VPEVFLHNNPNKAMTLPKTDKLVPNYDLEKEPLKMIRFGSNMHKKKLSTQTTKTVELSK